MSAPRLPKRPPRARWYPELALVAVLYAAYDSSRLLVASGLAGARRDGHALLRLERRTGLAPEHWLNRAFTAHAWLGVPADFAYATLHYLVTPAVLLWLWRRRPDAYRRARTRLGIATVAGLIGFMLFPTAPPRLLEASCGFADTMVQHAGLGWWGGSDGVPHGLGSLTNDYAAMPSLHVGWALWCGLVLYRYAERRTVRLLGVLYPLLIALVVLGTANHYLLDCLAGCAVMALAGPAAGPWLRGYDALRARVARHPATPAAREAEPAAPPAPPEPGAAPTATGFRVPAPGAAATAPRAGTADDRTPAGPAAGPARPTAEAADRH